MMLKLITAIALMLAVWATIVLGSAYAEQRLYGPPQQFPSVGPSRSTAPAAPRIAADYQRCVTVRNAPLRRPTKPVLYPNISDLS